MQVSDQELRKVEPLNALLRAELGVNPVFSWQWSESLTILYRDREEGRDWQVDPSTGLSLPSSTYIKRTVCEPEVVDRWVFCRLMTTTQEEWIRNFHDDMIWPENGRWAPMCGPLGYVALAPWEAPTRRRTFDAIRLVRQSRAETEAEFIAKLQARREAHKRATDLAKRDALEDIVPKLLAAPENTIYTFGDTAPGEPKGPVQ